MLTFLVFAYLAAVLAVGVYFVRQVKGAGVEQYALAGRSLGLTLLFGSLAATYIGGATVVGWTGSFYEMGFDWWFSALGALGGIVLATVVLARRARKLEQFTVPDLLAIRYGQPSRYVSSVLIIFGDIAMVTVQIIAIAGILTTFTDMDRIPAMIIGIVSFAVISLFGGMKGIAVTDTLQVSVIFVGLLTGVIVLFSSHGGAGQIFGDLPEGYFQPFAVAGGVGAVGLALAALGTTAASQSLVFTRVFAARDEKVARRGMALLIPAAFVGYGLVALLGYGGRAVLGDDVVPDDVFATIVIELLPPVIGAVMLATVIAAIVTTTNTVLLSASVNVARDLYQQLKPGEASSMQVRWVSQGAVAVFSVLSFILAVMMPDIVTAIVFAYTMYSAGLLIPLYAGYLWRGATPAAGVSTIVVGGGTALVWYVLGEPLGMPSMVPALAAALVAMIGVSLTTRKSTPEQLRVFDI